MTTKMKGFALVRVSRGGEEEFASAVGWEEGRTVQEAETGCPALAVDLGWKAGNL